MKQKTISQNAILNIIYTLTNMIFPILTFPYVSRKLLVESMGRISFYQSVSNYAIMVSSLGISTYGIRAVARCRDNKIRLAKIIHELLIINITGTGIVIVIILIFSFFVDRLRTDSILLLINILLIISAPLGVNWLYSGLEQYSFITKRSIAVKAFSLVAIYVFVKSKEDYSVYALIIALSSITTNIINFIYCRRFISFLRTEHSYKQHIKPLMLLFSSILAINIYTHLDSAMLGFICDDRQVGLYTVAVYVKSALLTLVNAISAVLLPRVSYFFSKDNQEALFSLLKKSISTIFMISVPLTIFFILEAKDCVLILGGEKYIDSVSSMQIIMPVLLISGFSNISGNQILIPQGKDSFFMKAVVCGACADLILNALLMPRYGCIGAAVATLIAEIIQMSIQMYFARNYIFSNIKKHSIMLIVTATCASSLVLIIVRNILSTSFYTFQFIICSATFFISYFTILLMEKEEYFISYLRVIKENVLVGDRK